MSLSMHEPASAAFRLERKRRKTRKGTVSCWECKRRKARCTFASPKDAICDGCKRRGTRCIGQEFDDEPGGGSSKHFGDRLAEVEAIVGQLAKNANMNISKDGVGSTNDRLSHEKPILASSEPPEKPSSPFLAIWPGQHIQAANRYEELSYALLAAWPSQHDLDLILSMPVGMSKLLHGVVFMPYASFTSQDTLPLRDILRPPQPGHHPVLIARKLLLLGKFLLGVPSCFTDNLEGLTTSCHEIMSRAIETASRLVTSNDEIVGSIEGIECIMIESMYLNNAGNLRRAYLAMRRAMLMAQMMGLHRGVKLTAMKTLELETQTRISPEYMWLRLVQSDRYLSMMLGLPQGSLDDSFATQTALESCTSLERMERLECVAAGRILQCNKNDAHDLVTTQNIDSLIQKASSCMPPKWWLIPDLTSSAGDDMLTFGETIRLMNQFAHYHLLVQLYLPHLLRSSTDHKYEYGKITAINASRELLARFVAFRSFQHTGSYCRGVDFLAFIASTALCLAHIDASHQRRSCADENYGTVFHFLTHQRLSDRGIMEQTLESIENMADAGNDAVASKIACILKHLLAIEADTANGASCCTDSYISGDEEELECNGRMSDDGNVLHIYIPYCGTIKIERSKVSKSIPEALESDHTVSFDALLLNERQEGNNSFGSDATLDEPFLSPWPAAGTDDWPLQGVDTALFDNLIGDWTVQDDVVEF